MPASARSTSACSFSRRRHASERAHLRVRQLATLHAGAHERQRRERAGHAHLLARGAEIDPRAPMQPVRAREEAVVPAGARVELGEQHEQVVGGGMEARGQCGDGLTEGVGIARSRGANHTRAVNHERIRERCGGHDAS